MTNDSRDLLHDACHSMQLRLDQLCATLPDGEVDDDDYMQHEATINNIIAIEAEWYTDPATAHALSRLQDY